MLHIYVKKSQVFVAVPPPPPQLHVELLVWSLNRWRGYWTVIWSLNWLSFVNYARKTQTSKSKKNYDLLCKVDKTNDSGAEITINKISEITLFIFYIKMFWSSNLYSFVPLFPKNRLMFPCSLRYFANVPFFPRTPAWETLVTFAFAVNSTMCCYV